MPAPLRPATPRSLNTLAGPLWPSLYKSEKESQLFPVLLQRVAPEAQIRFTHRGEPVPSSRLPRAGRAPVGYGGVLPEETLFLHLPHGPDHPLMGNGAEAKAAELLVD